MSFTMAFEMFSALKGFFIQLTITLSIIHQVWSKWDGKKNGLCTWKTILRHKCQIHISLINLSDNNYISVDISFAIKKLSTVEK